MSLFSSKKSKSSVSNSTTNNFTDQSANAGGDGSIALAQGSNLTINSLDGGVVADALSSNASVANYALENNAWLSNQAIQANNASNNYALGVTSELATNSLNANSAVSNYAIGTSAALAAAALSANVAAQEGQTYAAGVYADTAADALAQNASLSKYAIGAVSEATDSALAANNAANQGALEFASEAMDLNAAAGSKALSFADTQNERVFDYIGETTGTMLANSNRERIANQDLTASLARSAFALADEKTQSADDKVFNLGRTFVYAAAALIALFVLFRRPSKA